MFGAAPGRGPPIARQQDQHAGGTRLHQRSGAPFESHPIPAPLTLIGSLLALLTLYTIIARSDAMGDVTFAVPYVQLLVLLAGTVLASLAATIAPALSATRIRPAVALRTVA